MENKQPDQGPNKYPQPDPTNRETMQQWLERLAFNYLLIPGVIAVLYSLFTVLIKGHVETINIVVVFVLTFIVELVFPWKRPRA